MARNKFLTSLLEPKNLRRRSIVNAQIEPSTNKTIKEIKWLFQDDFTKLTDVLKTKTNKRKKIDKN
jgi:hypothetical protein